MDKDINAIGCIDKYYDSVYRDEWLQRRSLMLL